MRIGLEMFGTQTSARGRGIGRYVGNLAAALRARGEAAGHEFVFYAIGVEGLPTDRVPEGPNAVLRRLTPEPHLRYNLARLAQQNPDGLDALVFANPLELNPGLDVPARGREAPAPVLAAVVYDLIPLLFADRYLRRWPGTSFARRYFWGLERLRTYDRLLAISEATRADLMRVLNLPGDRVAAVGTAGDDRGCAFTPDPSDPSDADALRALGLGPGPFLLAVAGPDPHKNLDGLLDAFALLPEGLRASHALVVAAGAAGADKLDAVRRRAEARGVRDRLVLIGRAIDDPTLRALYRRCAAFVFPSLYEGFGLPVLEALACGAAVVAGDVASVPEVAGDAALLVNPGDPAALAGAIGRVLLDADLARSLRARGPGRAARFTWDAVADRVLATLEDAAGSRTRGETFFLSSPLVGEGSGVRGGGRSGDVGSALLKSGATGGLPPVPPGTARSTGGKPPVAPDGSERTAPLTPNPSPTRGEGDRREGVSSCLMARPPLPRPIRPGRPRVAFVSPLPPEASGVADYAASLLDALGDVVAVDLYHDTGAFPLARFRWREFGCFDHRLFARVARVRPYAGVVYQMGNSPAHFFAEGLLRDRPGVVVLHDLALASYHYERATRRGGGRDEFRRTLEACHPDRAGEFGRYLDVWDDEPAGMVRGLTAAGFDMNRTVVEAATAVIVHSRGAAARLGEAGAGKTVVIPHGAGAAAHPPTVATRAAARARLGLPPGAVVVGCFGIVHPAKLNEAAVAAFAGAARDRPDALLVFAGEEADDGRARRAAGAHGVADRVRFLGRVDDARFLALIDATDLGVSLRRPPTNGETSGALLHLLRAGVPAVVTDTGSFAEYPDEVVRKVAWPDDAAGTAALAGVLRDLLADPPGRDRLGRAGWEHVRAHHAWPRVAKQYAEVILSGTSPQPGPYRGPHHRPGAAGRREDVGLLRGER